MIVPQWLSQLICPNHFRVAVWHLAIRQCMGEISVFSLPVLITLATDRIINGQWFYSGKYWVVNGLSMRLGTTLKSVNECMPMNACQISPLNTYKNHRFPSSNLHHKAWKKVNSPFRQMIWCIIRMLMERSLLHWERDIQLASES